MLSSKSFKVGPSVFRSVNAMEFFKRGNLFVHQSLSAAIPCGPHHRLNSLSPCENEQNDISSSQEQALELDLLNLESVSQEDTGPALPVMV